MNDVFVLARRLDHRKTAAAQQGWRCVAVRPDTLTALDLAERIHATPAGKTAEWEASVVHETALTPAKAALYRQERTEQHPIFLGLR